MQYRASSRSLLQTTSTTHTIIDHADMIRKGHVSVLNTVAANMYDRSHNELTQNPNDPHDLMEEGRGVSSCTVNTTTTVSQSDHLVTPSVKRKKTTLKQMARTNIVTKEELRRRRPWTTVLSRHLYYRCGIWLFAVVILSSSLLHPILKIFLMGTSMTFLRNTLQNLIR